MRYQVRVVIFDILAECKELKRKLSEAGIAVCTPFLGLDVREALQEELEKQSVSGGECLLLTNCDEHAKVALQMKMAVAGCMEGHFTVPKTAVLLEEPEQVSVGYLDRVYCHAKKIPAVILETERMYVKELTEKDMDALYDILTDEEVGRYLPAKAGDRAEELEKLISYIACVYTFFEYGYWGVFSHEDERLIGRAGFKEGSYPPEVGYVLERSLWGNGFGTELLSALLLYAAEELSAEEILAKIDTENKASVRVAEKCGFTYEKQTGYYVKRV